NAEHNITPRSVSRAVEESLSSQKEISAGAADVLNETAGNFDVVETLRELEEEMLSAANNLEFEKAALLRDQVKELKRMQNEGAPVTKPVSYGKSKRPARRGNSAEAGRGKMSDGARHPF